MQGAEFHATAAAEDAGDAGAAMSNTSSPADSWTNILHNDLFMALPTNGPAASLQQRPTDQGCTPDSSAAGCELEAFRHPSDLHNWRHGLVPEVAAERPWLELQDAALQQVLGVSLQELQDGGHQVRPLLTSASCTSIVQQGRSFVAKLSKDISVLVAWLCSKIDLLHTATAA